MKIFKKNISVSLVCWVLLVFGCTTVRPVSLQETKKTDTVIIKPIIINNETKTVEGPRLATIHDTLYIKQTIKEISKEAWVDTTMMGNYLSRFTLHAAGLDEIKKMLLSLQLQLSKTKGADSQRVVLQKKLDTTTIAKAEAEKEIATTKTIIYDFPKYLFFILLIVTIAVLSYYYYVKRKLKRKEKPGNASK